MFKEILDSEKPFFVICSLLQFCNFTNTTQTASFVQFLLKLQDESLWTSHTIDTFLPEAVNQSVLFKSWFRYSLEKSKTTLPQTSSMYTRIAKFPNTILAGNILTQISWTCNTHLLVHYHLYFSYYYFRFSEPEYQEIWSTVSELKNSPRKVKIYVITQSPWVTWIQPNTCKLMQGQGWSFRSAAHKDSITTAKADMPEGSSGAWHHQSRIQVHHLPSFLSLQISQMIWEELRSCLPASLRSQTYFDR